MLESFAGSAEGKRLARALQPSVELAEIEQNQEETAAAANRIRLYGGLGFTGVKNTEDSLKRLEIGASLSISELLAISAILTVAGRAKAYGREDARPQKNSADAKRPLSNADAGDNADEDCLSPYFQAIEPLTPVNREIQRCLISEEEVADDASAGLLHVRRQKRVLSERIHTQLNAVLNSSRSMLQDAVITMRDGRYCLPVKSEYKASFPGMVHDQSATGSTLFIEPMSVVKLNNDIRELESQEKHEIELVLEALSGSLMPYTDAIRENTSLLAHLDFVFAKAKLADSMHAVQPKFNDRFYVNIKDGRHPLIDAQKVVPVSIYLGGEFDLLIITGPNTGGKTVCLKTVGLFQLMGQSGLFIPAFDGSELAVFDEIFADIGDEQSIEQSLSTFSAHMTNIVRILGQADARSLCLFDELGAGTDPTEGAALATAVLNYLHNMKTRTVATTHYAELKLYALSTPGIENACCEFDVATLRPTYRLLIGIPGKSNAFAISTKLGLPAFIVEDAKKLIETEDIKFEDVIASLEESRITIEKERKEIEAYKQEIAELKSRFKQKSAGLDERRDKILRDAKEEAARILNDAKDTADSVVKDLRKHAKNNGAVTEAEQIRGKLNTKLKNTQASMATKTKGPAKPISPKKIRIGDSVHVLTMNITGTVSTLPDRNGNLYVTAGIIRTKVNIKDLELREVQDISAPNFTQQKASGSGKIKMAKSFSISPEINLIGMTTDEAIPELEKYLDDAYLAHLPSVRVVHGRGTGALKAAVHKQLKRLNYVKEFRLGEFGEGDTGVTIVTFK